MNQSATTQTTTLLERAGIVGTAIVAVLFAILGGAAPTAFALHVLIKGYEHFSHLIVP